MGNTINVQIVAERNTFFPGNLVRGVVQLQLGQETDFNSLNLVFLSEIYQRWTTGSGKHRRTHTRITPIGKTAIPLEQNTRNITLKQGQHQLPFAFQLPPTVVPTVEVHGGATLRVQHRLSVEADVKHGFNRSGAMGIQILSQIPAQVHGNASPVQNRSDLKLNCCCCVDQGTVTQSIMMDRTVFSLDRDQLHFKVHFDNTKSKATIDNCVVSLVVSTVPKVGAAVAPSAVKFNVTVPCHVEPGQSGEASGVLNLTPLAPPSIQSNVLDVNYHVHLAGDTGCCTDDSVVRVPVLVAHSVDMTGMFAQQSMNAIQSMQPMDEAMFNSAGGMPQGFYQPNLYQQEGMHIPVWQPGMAPQAPPPPPPPDAQGAVAYGAFAPPPPDFFGANNQVAYEGGQ